jgi:hypothetical protein
MPVHRNNAGVFDNGGTSGCLWFYRGKANAVDLTTPAVGAPPTYYGDTPTGYLSLFSDTAWSGSLCTIALTVLTVGGTVTGTLRVGSTVYGAGVPANTQIISFGTGTGGAGTYNLSTSTTVSSAVPMGYYGVAATEASNGFGLTFGSYPSQTLIVGEPWYFSGGVQDPAFTTVNQNIAVNNGSQASPTNNSADARWYITFETNARWLAFKPGGVLGSGDQTMWEIDNRMLSRNLNYFTYAGDSNNVVLLDLSKFPMTENGFHKVRIGGTDYFSAKLYANYYTGPNDSIYPVQDANRIRLSLEGDSLISGGNSNPIGAWARMECKIGALLGVDTFYNNGVGGTGYLANSTTKTTYIQRLSYITAFAPDVHIVCGNANDGSFTSAQRVAAVTAYIQAFRAALPNAMLILTGTKVGGGVVTNGSLAQAQETDILTAVTAVNDSNTYFIPTTTDKQGDLANLWGWWPGGTANGRYFYISGSFTDGHPLPAEYDMFASRLSSAVSKIVNKLT